MATKHFMCINLTYDMYIHIICISSYMYIHIVMCIKILTNADCSKIFPKQIVYKTNTTLIITRQRITLQYLPRRNARENSFRSKGKITVTRWFLRFQPASRLN